jgi:hypothetical protein
MDLGHPEQALKALDGCSTPLRRQKRSRAEIMSAWLFLKRRSL